MHNENVLTFLRFVNERFTEFKADLDNLLNVISQDNSDAKAAAVERTIKSLENLSASLSAHDRPKWIDPLKAKLNWYLNARRSSAHAGLDVIKEVMKFNPDIQSQKWEIADASEGEAIDFNKIYEKFYRASRVPDLFDILIGQLQQIIDKGEIDSNLAIGSIQKLTATIRKNARGDYFSTWGSWDAVKTFFSQESLSEMENVPVLDEMVKSARSTAGEIDVEMTKVQAEIKEELHRSSVSGFALPIYKAISGALVAYHRPIPKLENKSGEMPHKSIE